MATLLSRTRSARTPANPGKPVLNSSRVISTTSTISSSGGAPSSTATSSPASNIALFLTNLRLLDLDRHPDWPDISALTFTTKDVVQGGQKKRIQCVEWALYHLFTLWDHHEAHNKLRPFFPPLDQVQSLNLRAALLRCLEQAKKNGVLGRDAVVRKTMLDECKGERLAEVLAVFSSAVLKKIVAEDQLNNPGYPALAQTLALENRGYTGDRSELNALILAHKISLHRLLEDKNAARARYKNFADALRLKEQIIAQRREQVEAARRDRKPSQRISHDQKLDLWRTVRNNWSGNERWMEALLYGDSHGKKDGALSAPFDRVWRRVQSGRLAELEDKSGGLLEQLDGRVQSQRSRLERWQSFRHEMFGKANLDLAAKETESRAREKGIDLGFRAHENLHLGRLSPRKLARSKPSELHDEYEELVHGLEARLTHLSQNNAQVPSFFLRPREGLNTVDNMRATSPEPEVISEISDIEDDFHAPPPPPAPAPRPEPVKAPERAFDLPIRRTKTLKEQRYPIDEEPITATELRRSATIQARKGRRPPNESPTRSPEKRLSPPPHLSPIRQSPPRPVLVQPPSSERITQSPQHQQPEEAVSPTQQLADQILASVNAASPSPVKKPRHTLSLAERTRLSMAARRTSQLLPPEIRDEDDAEPELDALPIRHRMTTPSISIDPVGPPSPDRQYLYNSPTRRKQRRRNGSIVEEKREEEEEADEELPLQTPDLDNEPFNNNEYEDLVSRTRRSMAGFEAARQKAQLERRRSQRNNKSRHTPPVSNHGGRRTSYFGGGGGGGVLDEEGEEDDDAVDGTTNHAMDSTLLIAEELMSGEGQNDYDAVFMSRPKIKTSPVGTPTKFRAVWD